MFFSSDPSPLCCNLCPASTTVPVTCTCTPLACSAPFSSLLWRWGGGGGGRGQLPSSPKHAGAPSFHLLCQSIGAWAIALATSHSKGPMKATHLFYSLCRWCNFPSAPSTFPTEQPSHPNPTTPPSPQSTRATPFCSRAQVGSFLSFPREQQGYWGKAQPVWKVAWPPKTGPWAEEPPHPPSCCHFQLSSINWMFDSLMGQVQ